MSRDRVVIGATACQSAFVLQTTSSGHPSTLRAAHKSLSASYTVTTVTVATKWRAFGSHNDSLNDADALQSLPASGVQRAESLLDERTYQLVIY